MTPQPTSGSLVHQTAGGAGPRARIALATAIAIAALTLLTAGPAQAGTYHMYVCGFDSNPSPFAGASGAGVSASAQCGNGGPGYILQAGGSVGYNQGASWSTTAPAGIAINHVYTQYDNSNGVGDGKGYYGAFNWDGGVSAQITDNFKVYGCCQNNFSSQHLSWAITCRFASGCTSSPIMTIGQIDVTLSEAQSPSIGGGGALWGASGWIRGTWPIGAGASDPSGVCRTTVVLGPLTLAGPGGTPSTGGYQQCPDQLWNASVDTTQAGNGTVGLAISATNAAGNGGFIAHNVNVDNTAPSVHLSGSTFAYANQGAQYINVSASAGPSGVSGINCSVDNGPYQYYPGSATSIGVAGPGFHHATCVAYNNARDASGNVAASAPQSWSTAIIEPTLAAIWFPTVHNPLRCSIVRKREKVGAHYKFVRRHGKRVRVRVPAHFRTVKVKDCRARVVRRRVAYWTTVVRNHHRTRVKHYRYVRSVVFPSAGHALVKHARFRSGTTIQGWLGASWLAPLAGEPLTVYAAPDNEQGQFVPVTYARTDADGVWTATLPPGPSRIVEVGYEGVGGGAVVGSVSGQIKVEVAAPVHMIRTPRKHVPWGSKLRFIGYLPGGWVPPKGELVRVRLGLGSAHTTVATISTSPAGLFSFRYHFGAGSPSDVRRFWFQFLTLPEGDYPFTQGASRKIYVTVGG